jgi:hypothetical protein
MFENLGAVMKMAKEMQTRMQDMQKNLHTFRVHGDAGAGMVRIEMNGRHEVMKVEIRDEAMEDREILEGLVHAAINDAVRRINEEMKSKMGELGLMNIPGLSDMMM